jgi:hypothetical protein
LHIARSLPSKSCTVAEGLFVENLFQRIQLSIEFDDPAFGYFLFNLQFAEHAQNEPGKQSNEKRYNDPQHNITP